LGRHTIYSGGFCAESDFLEAHPLSSNCRNSIWNAVFSPLRQINFANRDFDSFLHRNFTHRLVPIKKPNNKSYKNSIMIFTIEFLFL
jgi:hypothetical protein